MAKDLIFIHDYFCFVVYRNSELEPIPLTDIQNYVTEAPPESEEDNEDDLRRKNDEKTIVKLAKEYISKHLANGDEEIHDKPEKGVKLFPLEFNLIPLICYISLRVAKCPVFPKDIYEWIRNETMPYFSAHLELASENL